MDRYEITTIYLIVLKISDLYSSFNPIFRLFSNAATEHDRGIFCLERFSSELLFYYFNFDLSDMSRICSNITSEENILN